MSTRDQRLRNPRSEEWDPELADAYEPENSTSLSFGEPAGVAEPVRTCAECGCTDERACIGGCYWSAPALCSACDPNADDEDDEISPIQRALRGAAAFWGTHGIHD